MPPTSIDLGEDGRLRLRTKAAPTPVSGAVELDDDAATPATAPAPSLEDLVLAYVVERNDADVEPRKGEVRRAVPGDDKSVDRALDALVAAGYLARREQPVRGGRALLYRALSGQDVGAAADGKASE